MDGDLRKQAETTLFTQGWLARQSEAFRAEVSRRMVVQIHPPENIVYRLLDPSGGIYGLVSGALAVSFAAADGSTSVLQLGRRGAWVGIVPFLTGEPRKGELRCLTECVLAHLSRASMEAMVLKEPDTSRVFAQIALENLEAALELLRILLLPRAEQRIAAALLRATRSGVDPVPLGQADISTITNVSPRRVSAAIKEFARRGLVEPGYRWIRICDAEGLRVMVTGLSK